MPSPVEKEAYRVRIAQFSLSLWLQFVWERNLETAEGRHFYLKIIGRVLWVQKGNSNLWGVIQSQVRKVVIKLLLVKGCIFKVFNLLLWLDVWW
jgi:hypothetical protein